jgi:PAS domain S-box-containing protein
VYTVIVNQQNKRRILIVDDTPANLLALNVVLEPLGAEIVQAESGMEALARLAEGAYDAVILDVRMPGIDGFETASRIRSELKDTTTPILFVTASDVDKTDVARAYSHGHAELLPKPFVPEAMREKVRDFLEVAARQQTEREAATRRVSDAEQRLQLALTAAKMVAWVWDRKSDVVVSSDGANELFGHPLVTVKEFFAHVQPEDRADLDAALEAVWAGKGELDHEFRVMQPDGSVRWIEAKGRLFASESNSMFGVSLDVTQKRLAQTQLHELNEALKIARDQAILAMEAKSQFLNAFGHELKTPLNGIINYAEMIEEELEGKGLDRTKADARTIRDLGMQLNHVVEHILDLAHGKFPPHDEPQIRN